MENNELLWVEKYRPNTIKDVILPERLKNIFEQFVEKKEVPNLLLSGSAGVGKCLGYDTLIDIEVDERIMKKIIESGVTYILLNPQDK